MVVCPWASLISVCRVEIVIFKFSCKRVLRLLVRSKGLSRGREWDASR